MSQQAGEQAGGWQQWLLRPLDHAHHSGFAGVHCCCPVHLSQTATSPVHYVDTCLLPSLTPIAYSGRKLQWPGLNTPIWVTTPPLPSSGWNAVAEVGTHHLCSGIACGQARWHAALREQG